MKPRCLTLLASMVLAACSAPSSPPPPTAGLAGGAAGGASAGIDASMPPAMSGTPPASSGSASGSLRQAPACSYISAAEISDIVRGPIGKATEETNKKGISSCAYPPLDMTSYQQAQIDIDWQHGSAPSFERQLSHALGGSSVGRQVAHDLPLGDSSSYSREGVLSIRVGAALITITLIMRPDSEAKAVAIGTLLLQRMGFSTRQ